MNTILYVSTQTEMGGAQHSFLDVIRTVDTERFLPLAVVPNRGELYRQLQRLRIDTEVIPFTTPLPFIQFLNPVVWLRNTLALIRVARLAHKRSVSLIHCNDGAALYLAAIARLLHGIPVMFHVRWFEIGIRKTLVFFAARHWVDKIVTNSGAVREFVRKELPSTKNEISVIYNAINTDIFTPSLPKHALREELQLPEETMIVGMVGRFIGWKNHALFIKMVKRLRDKGNAYAFCLIGAAQFKSYTPHADALRRSLHELIHREGLERSIHLLGYRPDIERAIAGLDVLVCPSENEPFGRVVIEAMACGVPVVASNSGGIPEIITDGESGLLVPVNDEHALAEAVKRLLNDKKLFTNISHNGRASVESRFALKHLRQSVAREYDELLKRNSDSERQ